MAFSTRLLDVARRRARAGEISDLRVRVATGELAQGANEVAKNAANVAAKVAMVAEKAADISGDAGEITKSILQTSAVVEEAGKLNIELAGLMKDLESFNWKFEF